MEKILLPTDPAFTATLLSTASQKGVTKFSEDRFGRKVLAFSPVNGLPYEACPGCNRKAMTRDATRPEHVAWTCEFCGLIDCVKCPGGVHRAAG